MNSNAHLLRRAAATLRERAQAASHDEPWSDGDVVDGQVFHRYGDFGFYLTGPAGTPEFDDSEQAKADISYAAMMHPPVALALATAMDEVAKAIRFSTDVEARLGYTELIACARAVLREPEGDSR